MQLSIIIVNYNVRHFLQLCLDSVYAATQHIEAEIIVVDNASSDDSCAMVKQDFPDVHLIANTENVGFSKANNQGAAYAKGKHLCILNPDTVVGERVFEDILDWIAKNRTKNIGAIGVRLIDGGGVFLPESKRNLPTARVAFNKLFGNGNAYYANQIQPDGTGEVAILVGAFMFMEKAVYHEAKGFDEQYFMYGEDIDLSYSITRLGYQNYYLGSSAVIHFKGESTAKDLQYRKRFYGAMQLFYKKYFKQNSFERLFVFLGLKMASFLARSKRKELLIQKTTSDYLLITKQTGLITKIKNVLKGTVKQEDTFPQSMTGNLEVIVDAQHISYQQYITTLIEHAGHKPSFKIVPKNTTFAIGSDTSKYRGEVIEF